MRRTSPPNEMFGKSAAVIRWFGIGRTTEMREVRAEDEMKAGCSAMALGSVVIPGFGRKGADGNLLRWNRLFACDLHMRGQGVRRSAPDGQRTTRRHDGVAGCVGSLVRLLRETAGST